MKKAKSKKKLRHQSHQMQIYEMLYNAIATCMDLNQFVLLFVFYCFYLRTFVAHY